MKKFKDVLETIRKNPAIILVAISVGYVIYQLKKLITDDGIGVDGKPYYVHFDKEEENK